MPPVPNAIDEKLERRLGEDRLGRDVVEECRVQLMLKFRFLDLALWRMALVPMRAGAAYPLATDGTRVVLDPPRVIARFQESDVESVRDYLHLVMHCIFRHPFAKDHDCLEAWNLACDMVVESAVMDMCGERFKSDDDAARREVLSEVRMLVGALLPNKVYGLLRDIVRTPDGQHYRGLGRSALNEWHALFERDEHAAWPANNTGAPQDTERDQTWENVSEDDVSPDEMLDALRTDAPSEGDAASGGQDERDADAQEAQSQASAAAEDDAAEDDAEGNDGDQAAQATFEDAVSDDGSDEDDANDPDTPDDSDTSEKSEAERAWEDIAKQVEMDLRTFSSEFGDEAGGLMANLTFANRKKYDYSDFLRQFMVRTEEMQLNMDEFDYIYYSYGMELYGNMPLVEPLEYLDTERVHDFVIAIDTSESVSGPLVKRFLRHTFGMLKGAKNYASEVNIHIVQCDARVQSDTVVTNLREVDDLMESFTVRGFGGTDFRPVFGYVDSLIKRGEFDNLKGLIYFTDGLGTFPEKAPAYDVAFVFVDDEGRDVPPVPPWACKLVLDEEQIEAMGK